MSNVIELKTTTDRQAIAELRKDLVELKEAAQSEEVKQLELNEAKLKDDAEMKKAINFFATVGGIATGLWVYSIGFDLLIG